MQSITLCYGVQWSIPPVRTQLAVGLPHASLQKALPPMPREHEVISQAEVVVPPSTTGGTPPPSTRSHCENVPSENSQSCVLMQEAAPQQKTIGIEVVHTPFLHATPAGQSQAVVHRPPPPPPSGVTLAPRSRTRSGGASPSVQPSDAVIRRTNASQRPIIPL